MATCSNFLAWEIPWTEKPGGLQSLGSQRVRHDCVHTYTHIIQYVLCSCKRKETDTHTENARWRDRHIQREDSHLTEAETGVRQLQAKECQGLLATTRNWERDMEHILLLSP